MVSLRNQLEKFLRNIFEYSKVEAMQSLYLFYSPKYVYSVLKILNGNESYSISKYNGISILSLGRKLVVVIPEHHRVDERLNLYNKFIRKIMENFENGILFLEGSKYELTGKSRLRGLEDLIKEGKIEVVDIFKDLHSGDPSKLYMRLYDAIKKEAGDLIIIKAGIGHLPEIYCVINLVMNRYIADLSFEKNERKE